ncbi:MAG: peptide ABC transporter substrate-binding protein [Termitinemataceae bacterium]|nr:MAG: peptide ABC transporter substrate-binding protein [Termitinemataceae bacterium]
MLKKRKKNNLNGWVSMQINRKLYFVYAIGVILVLNLIVSCAGQAKPTQKSKIFNTAQDYAQDRPSVSDKTLLTVSFSGSDVEYDFRKSYLASEAQFYTALYEGLFSYHPLTMEPIPAAAEKWTLSDDKKEWTFTIRNGAKYNNGDVLKAQDFRGAWFSILDPQSKSPYSSLFDIITGARDYRLGIITDKNKVGITVSDDRTLKVNLVTPAAFFPSMLCHHSFSPIHPSMLKLQDWSAQPVISNGPFYVFENGERKKTLVRNEFYWGVSDVELKKIIIKYVEDGDEASALWNSGESRWISGEVNIDMLTDLSGINVNPMFATHYYYICSRKDPWTNPNVRRALSLALPWKKIRDGYHMPAKTLIYPIQDYPEINGVDTTDITEAKRLLKEAGFENGKGLPDLVIRLNPSADSERIGRLMVEAWKSELGVPIKIELMPFTQYFNSLKDGNYDVAASTWIGDFADPYTFLQMWRKDSNLNDAQNNDEEFEGLLEKSMGEEGKKRWRTLSQAEELLLNHGTVLPISYSFAVNIIDVSEIDGWYSNVLDIHPFKYMTFKSLKPLPGVVLGKPEYPGLEN